MYISIKWKGQEHSYWHLTGEYMQVSSKSVTPAVRRAVKRALEMKFPSVEIKDEEITITEVKEYK